MTEEIIGKFGKYKVVEVTRVDTDTAYYLDDGEGTRIYLGNTVSDVVNIGNMIYSI